MTRIRIIGVCLASLVIVIGVKIWNARASKPEQLAEMQQDTASLPQGTATTQPHAPLTVKQTLDQIDHLVGGGMSLEDYNKFKQANPDARPYLYALIQNDEQLEMRRVCAMGMLGWTGQAEDIPRIEAMIWSRRGMLRGDYGVTLMSFDALGLMAMRGVPGASEKLDQMIHLNYWKDVQFYHYDNSTVGMPPIQLELALAALRGKSAMSSGFDEAVATFRAGLTDDSLREMARPKVDTCIRTFKQWNAIRKDYEAGIRHPFPTPKPGDPVTNANLHSLSAIA